MNEKSHNAIEKIIKHADKAIQYTAAIPLWWEDSKTLEAVVFNLAQIGELVRFVDEEVQNNNRHINWPAMKGLRNRIIHDYDYIVPIVIKRIVENDLTVLIRDLSRI
ncbi:MAG TPA: hypothetical protein DCM45_01650 [Clostridiales bacterium]|nr:hypothetical protein [Clostridiales bacterium]